MTHTASIHITTNYAEKVVLQELVSMQRAGLISEAHFSRCKKLLEQHPEIIQNQISIHVAADLIAAMA